MPTRTLWLLVLLGSSNALAAPGVVGGDQAALGAWPDAAAICFGACDGVHIQCTGVLVAPNVVLTEGYCLQGSDPTAVLLDTNDFQSGGEEIAVATATAHPSYTGTGGHDIAVLTLAEAATTPPRALAYGCVQDTWLADGAAAVIVGYGAHDTQGTQYDSLLREGFTTITDADCTDLGSGCDASISPGGELGAGGDGVDACFGDGGGPLYLHTELGDFLVGIASRGYDGATVPCRDGGIWSRPDSVISWIEDTTGITIPETTCNNPPVPTLKNPFKVPAGGTRTHTIDPGDPDQSDGFTWAIVGDPAHGDATIDDQGALTYTASEDGYTGEDQVVVHVTDSEGYPLLTGELVVPVTVTSGCGGCTTPGAPATGWLGALLALLAVRRRQA